MINQFQNTKTAFTFATLLSTSSYLPGVIKLHRSLKNFESQFPFICICSIGITDKEINLLNKKGIECYKLERSAVDDINKFDCEETVRHWKYTFDKLLLWGLVQYKKIVYLDVDMVVMENIDELFSYPNFSAVQAGHLVNQNWTRLNSGLMVIEPDFRIMNDMICMIEDVFVKRQKQGLGTGDQDIINEYIPNWEFHKELILPESYNIFFKYIDIYCNDKEFKYENQDITKTIKVVHFIGNKKPWHYSFIKSFFLLLKYIVLRKACLKAYWLYLSK